MNTKKILGIAAVVLLVAAALVGAGAAEDYANEAKIGTTEYATLEDAIAAATEGQTITLLTNVDLTNYEEDEFHGLVFADDVTLDLGGYTITSNNGGVAYEGDGLIIKNGNFVAADNGSYSLFIGNGDNPTNVQLDNLSCSGGVNVYRADVVINNTAISQNVISGTNYYAVWADKKAKVAITNGTFNSVGVAVLGATTNSDETLITVNGGTYTQAAGKEMVLADSPVLIKGGNFVVVDNGGLANTLANVTVGTITLGYDVKDYAADICLGENVILDLNGHTVTTGEHWITGYGEIKSSVSGAKITGNVDVYVNEENVTVEAGTDNSLLNVLVDGSGYAVLYDVGGSGTTVGGKKLVNGQTLTLGDKIDSITSVYSYQITDILKVNGYYIVAGDEKYIIALFDVDDAVFDSATFVATAGTKTYGDVLLNGVTTDFTEAKVLGSAAETLNICALLKDATAATYFNYQKVTASELPAGTYMTADKANKLVVDYTISSDGYFYIPGTTVEGLYYLNGNDNNSPIYVQKAGYVDAELLKGTKVYQDNKFYARVSFAADVTYHIVLKKDDTGAFVKAFPSMNYTEGTYPLDNYKYDTSGYQLQKEDIGTWAVYAEIDADEMKSDTPEEYKYVKLGELKVVSNKDHGSTTATLSTDTVKNGNTFSIAVEAPKGDIITVGYRSDDDEDSFNKITTTNTNKVFYLLKGQENYDSDNEQFTVPQTENMSISIVAQTGLITDKKYTLVVMNESYTDDDNKAIEVELEITVKGNVFTAYLEEESYDIGENVKINGTYENSLPLYFYVEGSNITFMNIESQEDYAKKTTDTVEIEGVTYPVYSVVSDVYSYYTMKEKSNGTDWTFTILKELINGGAAAVDTYPADTRDIWNPGTYTIYVSTVAPTMDTFAVYDETEEEYVVKETGKLHEYTTAEKAKISAGGKVLTLTLTQPVITITYAQNEVEKNKFEKITIDAQGTDKLQVYVVGQNQTKFISVQESSTLAGAGAVDTTIYSMKSGDANYLYATGNFSLDGTGLDNSISNVLKYYGPTGYATESTGAITSHLAVKNTDGTYSIYVFIPSTNWDYGQYYLVAQHPMSDGKFNVTAYTANGDNGYNSGVNVYANPTYTNGEIVPYSGTFLFNIPSVAQLDAAQKLVTAIENYNDKQHGGDFWVVAEADELNNIIGVEASYNQGEIITILVNNADNIDGATLEANTFDFTADNLNYIQSFAVEQSKSGDNIDLTMTLDTTGVPAGDYVIVIKDGNDVVKTYETKIVGEVTPVVEVTVSISGASSLTVGDTTVLKATNSDGSTGVFKWTSSDASVASVDEDGNVVAKKAGTVTITVTNTLTGKTATKTIVVADISTPSTPETPSTPGFGIIAALAGLGAVAALVLRRK